MSSYRSPWKSLIVSTPPFSFPLPKHVSIRMTSRRAARPAVAEADAPEAVDVEPVAVASSQLVVREPLAPRELVERADAPVTEVADEQVATVRPEMPWCDREPPGCVQLGVVTEPAQEHAVAREHVHPPEPGPCISSTLPGVCLAKAT